MTGKFFPKTFPKPGNHHLLFILKEIQAVFYILHIGKVPEQNLRINHKLVQLVKILQHDVAPIVKPIKVFIRFIELIKYLVKLEDQLELISRFLCGKAY